MNLKNFPTLSKILSNKTFSVFEGPLFEGAKVRVKTTTAPDGSYYPDPATAELLLPDITSKESEMVDSNFSMTVKKEFEDKYAMTRTYAFTFEISDMKFSPLENGMVRPVFTQKLKEFTHE